MVIDPETPRATSKEERPEPSASPPVAQSPASHELATPRVRTSPLQPFPQALWRTARTVPDGPAPEAAVVPMSPSSTAGASCSATRVGAQCDEPERSCSRTLCWESGVEQVRCCPQGLLRRAQRLLCSRGWPGPNDGATRSYISELLGLDELRGSGVRRVCTGHARSLSRRACLSCGVKGKRSLRKAKQTTHVGWVSSPELVAAAILSVYRYRGRRCCACLEYIASKARGAGTVILSCMRDYLGSQRIPILYSGVDLSRPYALAAHRRWGFSQIQEEEWARAGLAFYGEGDVLYMRLHLDL